MKVLAEAGVQLPSERYFMTPSSLAKRLFFYVTRCGHYYCSTAYDFHYQCEVGQEESHRNFLLFYLRAGSIRFESDGIAMTGTRGQCALVDCRLPHRFTTLEDSEQIWVHFDGANAKDFFAAILARNGGKHVFTPPFGSCIERDMAELVSQIGTSSCSPETTYSQKLYGILCDLLYPSEPVQTDHAIRLAMQFIKEHLHEPLCVGDIAAAAHLSPSHFSRRFRAQTGFSPHEYVVLHRIDEAKSLLHSTTLSVKEIAYCVGYHSEVNFISSFIEKVGMTPGSFRKSIF